MNIPSLNKMSCNISSNLTKNNNCFVMPWHSWYCFSIDKIYQIFSINKMKNIFPNKFTFIKFFKYFKIFFIGIRIIFPNKISMFGIKTWCWADDFLRFFRIFFIFRIILRIILSDDL
jgi:hypothetical protein